MSSGSTSGRTPGYKNVLEQNGRTRTGSGGLRTTHVSIKQDKSRSSRNIGVAALPTPMLQRRRVHDNDQSIKLVPTSGGTVWGGSNDKNGDVEDCNEVNAGKNESNRLNNSSPWTRNINSNNHTSTTPQSDRRSSSC